MLTNYRIASSNIFKFYKARPGSYAEATLIFENEGKDDLPLFSLFSFGPSHSIAHLKSPYSTHNLRDPMLVGCDRGIVCFTVNDKNHPQAHCPTSTYFWNPETILYKLIPPHNTFYDYKKTVDVDFGFGFDLIENDFKVVRILTSRFATEVYSVKMNAWRKV
ncbi:hypothetical protein POM88_028636 [Heracleum sosnowskyi]|uniref:F-box protein n=1 Tax=Heracleum sosnowskyi TaxID=360622 RepID=A0AAD8HT81_9APIA|nr:hypothetical protein POM88_028636 [Heracleum sosnowskyi]